MGRAVPGPVPSRYLAINSDRVKPNSLTSNNRIFLSSLRQIRLSSRPGGLFRQVPTGPAFFRQAKPPVPPRLGETWRFPLAWGMGDPIPFVRSLKRERNKGRMNGTLGVPNGLPPMGFSPAGFLHLHFRDPNPPFGQPVGAFLVPLVALAGRAAQQFCRRCRQDDHLGGSVFRPIRVVPALVFLVRSLEIDQNGFVGCCGRNSPPSR